jgi:ABC-type glycerol-3-phosphate transport system permease component
MIRPGLRRRRVAGRWALFAVAVGVGVVMLIPFALMVSTAFKPHAYVLETPPRLIPTAPTIDNFVDAWTGQEFGRYFVNSVIVAVCSTAIAVTLGSMLAFAFARYSFPGRRVLFGALLVTMMVPGMVLLIPQFVLAKNLGLLNSLQGLVLVYATMNLGLNTFLLRGFFSAMPQEIFDAAEVDGAGVWGSFWRVGVPLARPGIATVTLFSFLAAWDEFTWAIVSLSDKELYTLPIAVRSLQRAQATEWGLVFAASLIALAPVLLLFVLLQKQFVSGAFVGATKG